MVLTKERKWNESQASVQVTGRLLIVWVRGKAQTKTSHVFYSIFPSLSYVAPSLLQTCVGVLLTPKSTIKISSIQSLSWEASYGTGSEAKVSEALPLLLRIA